MSKCDYINYAYDYPGKVHCLTAYTGHVNFMIYITVCLSPRKHITYIMLHTKSVVDVYATRLHMVPFRGSHYRITNAIHAIHDTR